MAYAGTVKLGEIAISYECEQCGKPDSYNQVISGDYSNQRANYIGPGIAAENRLSLIKRLQERIARIYENYDGVKARKCPQCGHHQTWMYNSLLNRTIEFWAGGVVMLAALIILAVILIPKFSWSTLLGGLFMVVFVGVIVYAILVAIIQAIFKKKKKAIGQLNLKKPPVLLWKGA